MSVLCCAATISRAQTAADAVGSTVVAPGDVLRIAVWRRPEFSGDFLIASDGSITHPLLRTIHAGGQPVSEIENRLRAFLSQFDANPAFSVIPLIRISVLGEVRQPQMLVVALGTTVAEAVAVSGGNTDRGDLKRVTVVRGAKRFVLDLTQSDAANSGFTVNGADQVIVARRNSLLETLAPATTILTAILGVANMIVILHR